MEAGEKEERNYSIEYAWQDFKNNPVIGSQYVGTYDNFYPHNIIIEVFMATGIIGAFCFFMFIFGVVKKIILHYPINYHYLEFQYILIPTLFIGLTSGSLMFSSDLWLTVALYLCINRNSQQTY